MKLLIKVDVDTINGALAALAIYGASIAKHAAEHPESAFNWSAHVKLVNDQAADLRKAIGNAELVDL